MLDGSEFPKEPGGDQPSSVELKSTVKVVAGAEGCEEAVAAGAVALMVDALRASATITALTSAGADTIFVATHVEQARRVKEQIGDVLLIGEREGFPPEGFDAGNSPAEVLELGVVGRQIGFTSTTGAARLGQLRGAAAVLVGGPVNARAAIEAAARLAGDGGHPIYAIAAGLTGRPGGTEEDWLGAALLAQGLAERGHDWINRDDHLNEHWPVLLTPENVCEGFFAGGHGQSLVEKGLGDDITDCSRVDWFPVVAQVVGYREIDDGPPVAELKPLEG